MQNKRMVIGRRRGEVGFFDGKTKACQSSCRLQIPGCFLRRCGVKGKHIIKKAIMKRTRSDAKWNGLSPAQQQKMESWLFEENLDYEATRKRAETEFGFAGSASSVQRFCARKKQERCWRELVESGREAEELSGAPVNMGAVRTSSLMLLAQRFFRQMRDEGIADAGVMGKLLMQAEANELRREQKEIQREGQQLRRERLEFQRQRWQYDLAEETARRLPELLELQKAHETANDPYAENKRLNAIRKQLFGSIGLPGLFPESAAEEAAEAAAEAPAKEEQERKDAARKARWMSARARTLTDDEACRLAAAEEKAEREAAAKAETGEPVEPPETGAEEGAGDEPESGSNRVESP